MAWIGLLSGGQAQFNVNGISAEATEPPFACDDRLLVRGSIMLETGLTAGDNPLPLFQFIQTHPWRSGLSLQALPQGGFILIHSHAGETQHTLLPFQPDGRADTLRVTYSWDAPAKRGTLTLERPERDTLVSVDTPAPHPLRLGDLRTMLTDPRHTASRADLAYLALSDRVEPVGPMPGLTANLPVFTPHGPRAALSLKRGDTVHTAGDGGVVPVLQAIRRTVPAYGSFRPVRLRAPYFGLRHDIIVAPEQRLVLDGSKVEYMFGKEAVLVPARHLVNNVAAMYAPAGDLITYCQVILPEHESLIAGGAALDSLYIGRIRRKPAHLAASLLADLPRNSLPEHPRPVWPVLKPFEALVLADYRAA